MNWFKSANNRHHYLRIVSGPAQGRTVEYYGTPKVIVIAEVSKVGLVDRTFWHDYSQNKYGNYAHSRDCRCNWHEGRVETIRASVKENDNEIRDQSRE